MTKRLTRISLLGLATLGGLSGCGSGDTSDLEHDAAIPDTAMSTGPDTGPPDGAGGDVERHDALPDSTALHDAQTNDGTLADADSASPDSAPGCHKDSDCASSAVYRFCSPGGTPVGCGTCLASQAPCSVDSECQQNQDSAAPAAMVCAPAGPCTCPSAGKSGMCIPACAASFDCSAGLVCQSGHCSARPCSVDSDCPPIGIQDYACVSGHCSAKPCSSDADCHGGYCINSACSSQPGACAPGAA